MGIISNSIKSMSIWDKISCRYSSKSNTGLIGSFSELGTCVQQGIPVNGTANPDGLFYFIKASNNLLIADRNIQTNISYDTLKSDNIPSGTNILHNWQLTTGDYGLAFNAVMNYNYSIPVVYKNELYSTYSEPDENGVYQIRLKKYNSTNNTWSFIAVNASNSLNNNANYNGWCSSLAVYNNELYIMWYEDNTNNYYQIVIAKYDGTTYTIINNNLNYNQNEAAHNPMGCVYNNELYIVWSEISGANSSENIRVKKYNGSIWTFVDGGIDKGLNYDPTEAASYPSLLVYNNELYCMWSEFNKSTYVYQLRVKKYNGITWTFIDGGGANGINFDSTRDAQYPFMIVHNNMVYISWSEVNPYGNVQLRLKRYNGSTWEFVDGNSIMGLNYNNMMDTKSSSLVSYNNELYISWIENTQYSKTQVRLKKYNNTSWTYLDGESLMGINYNNFYSANNPFIAIYNNELYCSWYEQTQYSTNQIVIKRLKSYNISTLDPFIGKIRLLTGGINNPDTNSEWNSYIANNSFISNSNDIWNWNSISSWTSTISNDISTNIITRGNSSAIATDATTGSQSNSISSSIGFRPVLVLNILDNNIYGDIIIQAAPTSTIDNINISGDINISKSVLNNIIANIKVFCEDNNVINGEIKISKSSMDTIIADIYIGEILAYVLIF